ncbi:type III effector [Burkholderia sp. WAC0059]|uniref:four-carbon acid sugar kinase family protein n=1 Tax=Burkholderia sp. WAC0059 TaxID=2066022 RepID=UPI000C7F0A18|nr:four-carbon acid sugar kinase family protein [Burkholderia sp. WAC0059]PLZ03135.1 type III effector [Burkholderia sp. WAC0059]
MLRLAFYGDDFTGSTDALEVLALAGLRCALFLKAPTRAQLDALGGFDAIGIAGDSRAMSPAEMDAALPAIFRAMQALDAPLLHYKVCSTFDSSPSIGSIGRVLEIARATIATRPVPIVAGTPALHRYCLFGHLFARSGTDGNVYRIDRHPVMSVHPVTPMDESDLVRHFGRQCDLRIANFDVRQFDQDRAGLRRSFDDLLAQRPDAIVLDTADARQMTEVGRLLDAEAQRQPGLFTLGSSGVEYGLTQWWNESGATSARRPDDGNDGALPPSQGPILAISGSASPVSALQIDAAVGAGFREIALDAHDLVDARRGPDALRLAVDRIATALDRGDSVVAHTAKGPRDPRIAALLDALVAGGLTTNDARHLGGRMLGRQLGVLTASVLRRIPVRRLVLSGGDTSSQVTQRLAPDALVFVARLAPGAPLCRVVSTEPHLRQLEIALKGGQMGDADYLVRARSGRRQAAGRTRGA